MFRSHADERLGLWLLAPVLVAASIAGLIVAFVFRESLPALSGGVVPLFDWRTPWHPLEGRLGLAPMVVASLVTTLGALVIAVPVGIGSALLSQCPAVAFLATPYRWMLGLLAGIPSVVFGLWGLTVLAPLIAAWQAPGVSLLAGMLILALMVLPTIALTAEAAFAAVPAAQLHAAHALGLTQSAITWRVLIPSARRGLAAGVALACARALGETMAVLMVTGNVAQMPHSLFDPVRTLTANIALEMAYATSTHRASLFLSGLVLSLLVTAIALLAHRRHGTPAAA